METRRIFYAVARKWWLVVLLAVLGGGIGFLSVFFAKPVYQADVTLYIKNTDVGKPLSLQDFTVSQYLVQQYSDILSSRTMTSAIINDVKNYNIPAKELLPMINIQTNKDSNIFTISARGSDPAVAVAVANAAGDEFVNHLRELTSSDSVGILETAQVPNFPVNNRLLTKILFGSLAGLMVAFCIIYLLEYFDTRVRSAEDLVNGLKVRVIGIIPEHDIR